VSARLQTRREFLESSAAMGASLVIAFYLPVLGCDGEPSASSGRSRAGTFQPNAWLAIHPDGSVDIWTGRSEMGQGVKTSLPMIVAEELGADWREVNVIQADADPAYGDQITVASRSVSSGWEPLRQAGAAAREMLVTAASVTWKVSRESCRAEQGVVRHEPSGRELTYGELVDVAATVPVPEDPPLKDPREFRLIGTPVPRVDTLDKVTGRAIYGLDVRVPGMVHAAVARSPVFGGRVRRFDPAPALAVPGVTGVLQISPGVAVLGENNWAVFQGKQALDIEWDEGPVAQWSSEGVTRAFVEAVAGPGETVRGVGDVDDGLKQAAKTLEAIYEAPYLAHACMEPMNCTAHVREGRCEIWAPTQHPQGVQREAARVLDRPEDAITVHVTYLGGGFGRRSGSLDYAIEAVELAAKLDTPVQVAWTREDDIRNGVYRPATYHLLRAGLDGGGRPVAWSHRLAAPEGPAFMITRGADELIYPFPHFRLERTTADPGIPLAEWRGVGPSHNEWVVESFVDELAHAARRDPYAFRRELVADRPRLLAVLDAAARNAGWNSTPPTGQARGIALSLFAGTHIAEVADVSVSADGEVRVYRVVVAIDCGIVVNPDTVEAQTQSNIVYGLTAALYGQIGVDRGRVIQSNFHDYQMLRMAEMPEVEVHLIRTDNAPSGVGEAALPAVAPAVCNAIYAATGKRVRKLPIERVS
jgi:isoquinoline 1-oxidoreductase beta subunit